MPSPLRVAVLGCWHVHAKDYAGEAVRHPGVELVAVWDDHPVRGRQGAADFGAPFVDDLEALLARDDVGGLLVTTATSEHHALMTRAAAAGKHLFSEKLLAPTVAEAEDIAGTCQANDVVLTVSLPRLYHGYTQSIAAVLADGRLGRLTYGRVRLSHDGAVAGWLPERFFDPGAAIGGALTDLGCHPVYLTQLFLGTNPDTVSATYRSLTGHPVEDHAVVTLGYPDQAIGVAEAGFVSRNPFTVELFGTDASLSYSAVDGLRISTRDGGRQQLEVAPDVPGAFAQWVAHIADGTRADDNIARAIELTRLVVAANEAAAGGRSVSYPQG